MEWKFRHPAHYVAGGIAGWFLIDNPIGAIGLILIFYLYEIWQGYRKKDMSYWDMLEFAVSAYVVATGLYIWGLF